MPRLTAALMNSLQSFRRSSTAHMTISEQSSEILRTAPIHAAFLMMMTTILQQHLKLSTWKIRQLKRLQYSQRERYFQIFQFQKLIRHLKHFKYQWTDWERSTFSICHSSQTQRLKRLSLTLLMKYSEILLKLKTMTHIQVIRSHLNISQAISVIS